MNYKKYVMFLSLSFLFISCDNNTIDPVPISYYPIASNLEWEYSTTFKTEYYDTLGNIKNFIIDTVGNSIVRIESLNDTVNDFTNLVRFISYQSTPYNSIGTTWYENKNDGLYAIAYKNAGASQPVIPKVISGKNYLGVEELKQIGMFLDFNVPLYKTAGDSIQYWTPARKVLAFPIKVGVTWNELQNPFYRDRIVDTLESKNIGGFNYTVYKIGAVWRDYNIVFNDYISTKYGLVFREIVADSAVSTTPSGTFGGFVKITTNSKLVRRNF